MFLQKSIDTQYKMITFLPAGIEQGRLSNYQELFLKCFPGAKKFESPSFLRWLYADNPDGEVIGFDAFDGDRLIAHYACIPAKVRVDGAPIKALLSLNTATHPDYQGKGLFIKLAELTYEAGAEFGFDCVYGIANANSTPGFVRKLRFQLVQPLDAMIGMGRLNIDFSKASREAQFERIWTPETLKWRCSNPINPIYGSHLTNRLCLEARASGRLVSAYTELPVTNILYATGNEKTRAPLRLYLGLVPNASCAFSTYVHIPQRLRPSPLNLIYRPLGPRGTTLEKGHIHFSFLDFDAY